MFDRIHASYFGEMTKSSEKRFVASNPLAVLPG